MKLFDAAAFGRRVAQTIKEHVAPLRAGQAALEAQNAALLQRLETVERSLAAATMKDARIDRSGVLFLTLGDGSTKDLGHVLGRDADPAQVKTLVDETVERRLAAIPPARAAAPTAAELRPVMVEVAEAVLEPRLAALKSAAPAPPAAETFRGLVAELVDAAIAALPAPQPGKPGRDADPAQVKALVEQEVAARITSIELPKPPAPAPETFRPLVAELVETAIAALPAPQPGKPGRDADPAQVKALVEQEVAARVAALPAPKNGRGIARALIDDAGELVLSFTDGDVQKAGRVKGRDGADLESVRLESEDGRTFRLEMTAGGRVVKSAPVVWAGLVDRGIWRGERYASGDGVTFKGSYWIAERDTDGRPGEPDSGWRLAVKRGRDGRPDRGRGHHVEGGAA